jgi:phosphohistidine phosphatase
MRRLFLLRHAKSSWDDPDLDDHDRPLAPRGRRAAKAIAAHLRGEGIVPDLVLSSSALRTRQTLERIEAAFGDDVQVAVEDELYAASADELLDRVRAVADESESLMLIGHNPGLEQLALTLAGSGDDLPALRRKYPTAALATLTFDGRWADLAPGGAELTGFVTPKQLSAR